MLSAVLMATWNKRRRIHEGDRIKENVKFASLLRTLCYGWCPVAPAFSLAYQQCLWPAFQPLPLHTKNVSSTDLPAFQSLPLDLLL
jgi:hypothetical protein